MRPTEHRMWRSLSAIALALSAWSASAHEPVARCYLLNESTVRCRGASNDGDEMPGARMKVFALDGAPLIEGKLTAQSTWTFKKPVQAFYVLFDTGPGLQVTVEQDEISPPPRGRVPRWMQIP